MTNETETLTSGIDPALFSSVIKLTNDLSRYVNGSWIDTYRLPDNRSRYGSLDKLVEDVENQVCNIFDADDCPAVKSEALYRSFLNTDAIEAAGLDPIRDELNPIGSAIDKAALTRVLDTINPAGGPDSFSLAVYGDLGGPDRNIAHLKQAGLCLPDEAYYREDHYVPVREAYVAVVATQPANAGYAPAAEFNGGDELLFNIGDDESNAPATAPSEAAFGMVRHFLVVETKIVANHRDNVVMRDSVKTYNPIDYADLATTLKNFNPGSWIDAWQTAYDATEAAKAQLIDFKSVFVCVIVRESGFLTDLDAFWAEADLADLKLWARIHMILDFTSSLSHDFDTTNFDFYGKVLSGAKKQRDRWKRAVSLVNGICDEDVDREYARLYFPESLKRRMEELVTNLIDACRVFITNPDWLSEDTKAEALEKIPKSMPKIGYTNHWHDHSVLSVSADALPAESAKVANLYETGYQLAKVGKSVDKDEWLMNPQTMNTYYELSMNVIVFPAAVLQPLFSNPKAEDAANYGGADVAIGHEISHGFDDQGSQYDGDSKFNNWWTDEDRKDFEAHTGVLIAQYNSFVSLQLAEKCADEPGKAPYVDGTLTIDGNIGDLGGVNIAFKAYALALGKTAGKSDAREDGSPAAIKVLFDTTPEMDGFIGLQRFFLSHASIWHTKNRDELAKQYLQIDLHSPAEFRINGIASNVDLFCDAFGVAEGDAMWLAPKDRVRIW